MQRLNQLAKTIQRSRSETALNTRRAQANFPLVERKLDVVAGDVGYSMEFPLTNTNHSAVLTLTVKPDNCCECEPGAATRGRDCTGYYEGGHIGPSNAYEDDVMYSASYTGDAQPYWKYNVWVPTDTRTDLGLVQSGENFNYGYQSPFVIPIWQDTGDIAGYSVAPNGRIKIPVDGVYSVLFLCTINGTVTGPDSTVTQMIRVDHMDGDNPILDINGNPFIETTSKKVYNVGKLNLESGGGPPGTLNPSQLILYATCTNFNKGDTVGGWLMIHGINDFHAAGGWLGDGSDWGDDNNRTSINLLGKGFGTLIGYVYDISDHSPLQGATLSYTLGFGGHTMSDEFGGYSFDSLEPDTYSITATMAGYKDQTQTTIINFNKITELDFNLTHI
jgi:Carboxypeptidase regulatory-like domain